MLSKKIELYFSNLIKKDKSNQVEDNTTEDKRHTAIERGESQAKVTGFAIGFFINIALGELILSIALVII